MQVYDIERAYLEYPDNRDGKTHVLVEDREGKVEEIYLHGHWNLSSFKRLVDIGEDLCLKVEDLENYSNIEHELYMWKSDEA